MSYLLALFFPWQSNSLKLGTNIEHNSSHAFAFKILLLYSLRRTSQIAGLSSISIINHSASKPNEAMAGTARTTSLSSHTLQTITNGISNNAKCGKQILSTITMTE